MPPNGALNVGVIGGGIAGMTAAIALRRAGHVPTVFERTPSLRLAGGALLVWPPALKALADLGLAEEVEAAGTRLSVMEIRSWEGQLATTLQLGHLGGKGRAGCILIRRAALLQILANAASASVTHFGASFEAVDSVEATANDGAAAQAVFRDLGHQRFDLVIGADGIHSTVREFVQGPRPLRPGGRTAWVGIVRGRYPLLDCGVTINTVGTGVSFLCAGMKDGWVYWYGTLTNFHGPPTVAKLVERLQGSHEPILDVVQDTPAESIVATEVRDLRPAAPWSRGRVTLIGDAAHPCAPDLGQGACQAIESAVSLARHLRDAASIEAALAAYESERFARCALVTAVSRGTLFHDLLDDPRMNATWIPVARWGFPLVMPRLLTWLAGDAVPPPAIPTT